MNHGCLGLNMSQQTWERNLPMKYNTRLAWHLLSRLGRLLEHATTRRDWRLLTFLFGANYASFPTWPMTQRGPTG